MLLEILNCVKILNLKISHQGSEFISVAGCTLSWAPV